MHWLSSPSFFFHKVQLPLSQINIPGNRNSNSNSNSRRGGRREKTETQFPLHRYLHTSYGNGNMSTGYNASIGNSHNGDGDEISIFNGLTTVTVLPGDMLYVEEDLSVYPVYTLYTPFIHLHYHIYTYVHPLYMYIHHIYTIYTPNTPLTPHIRLNTTY